MSLIGLVWVYMATLSIITLAKKQKAEKIAEDITKIIKEDIIPFQIALEKYVLPRRLTPRQVATISDYLSKNEKYTFNFVVHKNDEEASVFRSDIQSVLTDSGWILGTIEYSDDMVEGLRIDYQEAWQEAQKRPDRSHPKPDQILEEAFRQAGLLYGSSGGSGRGINDAKLTIQIGPRRRDTYGDYKKLSEINQR